MNANHWCLHGYLLAGVLSGLLGPTPVRAESPSVCAEALSSAHTFLRRSATRERKLKVAEGLVTLLHEEFGIQASIHPFSEDETVLVAIHVPEEQRCASQIHWLARLQCHLHKDRYQLGLIVGPDSRLESAAWVTEDPRLLALPMDSLFLDRAGSVAAHEWVHVRSNVYQERREKGEIPVGENLARVPVRVKSSKRLKSRELELHYGGAAKGREGHWLEENDAFLKEGRFELANARAELRKLQERAPTLTRAEVRKEARQIQKKLDLAEEYLNDFQVFFEADFAILDRFLRNLRLASLSGDKRAVFRLPDGSTLDFAIAGIQSPHAFLQLQRQHLADLSQVSVRARVWLSQARAELSELTKPIRPRLGSSHD